MRNWAHSESKSILLSGCVRLIENVQLILQIARTVVILNVLYLIKDLVFFDVNKHM